MMSHSGLASPPRRNALFTLVVLLYMALLVTDAVRKLTGLPSGLIGVVYFLTAAIYILYAGRSQG